MFRGYRLKKIYDKDISSLAKFDCLYELKEINYNNKLESLINSPDLSNLEYLYLTGLQVYAKYKFRVKESLKKFLLEASTINNDILDGDKIIKSWFPEIKADIFLSHSHNDEYEVIALAGWLYQKFCLTSFIDSCIWGYGNELIKVLDDEYSLIDKKIDPTLYSYEKCLLSSSHVHMMLATALAKMIDNTECVIFYDKPNSIQAFDDEDKTKSPWIYSELVFSDIVRERPPKRIEQLRESKNFANSQARGQENYRMYKLQEVLPSFYKNYAIFS